MSDDVIWQKVTVSNYRCGCSYVGDPQDHALPCSHHGKAFVHASEAKISQYATRGWNGNSRF